VVNFDTLESNIGLNIHCIIHIYTKEHFIAPRIRNWWVLYTNNFDSPLEVKMGEKYFYNRKIIGILTLKNFKLNHKKTKDAEQKNPVCFIYFELEIFFKNGFLRNFFCGSELTLIRRINGYF
jgi:hypothetical protein